MEQGTQQKQPYPNLSIFFVRISEITHDSHYFAQIILGRTILGCLQNRLVLFPSLNANLVDI